MVVDVVVVVVVDAGGAGEGVKTPLSVVPLPALPKMSASGFPEISSMAVMKSRARAKTMPTVAAMAPHENPSGAPDRRGPGRPGGSVVARRCSVAGASATAEISRRCGLPRWCRCHLDRVRRPAALRRRPSDDLGRRRRLL